MHSSVFYLLNKHSNLFILYPIVTLVGRTPSDSASQNRCRRHLQVKGFGFVLAKQTPLCGLVKSLYIHTST